MSDLTLSAPYVPLQNSLVTKESEVKMVFLIKLPVCPTYKARRITFSVSPGLASGPLCGREAASLGATPRGACSGGKSFQNYQCNIRVALPEAPVCLFLLSHLAAT